MYYQRLDVRQAITDFANASGSGGLRECAFYNARAKSIQRYIGENGSKRPVDIDSPAAMEQALALGASAFYCSYWRYDGQDSNHPTGRDLVWTIRAEQGGLGFAKLVTARVLEALADAGVEPWVKYCGDLGFDLIIPLEAIPYETWMSNTKLLDVLQRELTSSIVGYLAERSGFSVEARDTKNGASHVPADWRRMKPLDEELVAPMRLLVETQGFPYKMGIQDGYLREHFSDITVEGGTSPVEIKQGGNTCLLSELRVRRGLLLAPMSLNPETGLVSVPVDPKRVGSFSIFDASPGDVRAFEWVRPSKVAHRLIKYAQAYQPSLSKIGSPSLAQFVV